MPDQDYLVPFPAFVLADPKTFTIDPVTGDAAPGPNPSFAAVPGNQGAALAVFSDADLADQFAAAAGITGHIKVELPHRNHLVAVLRMGGAPAWVGFDPVPVERGVYVEAARVIRDFSGG